LDAFGSESCIGGDSTFEEVGLSRDFGQVPQKDMFGQSFSRKLVTDERPELDSEDSEDKKPDGDEVNSPRLIRGLADDQEPGRS
jgi:hypothetical protein